jgi:hypothetical protein
MHTGAFPDVPGLLKSNNQYAGNITWDNFLTAGKHEAQKQTFINILLNRNVCGSSTEFLTIRLNLPQYRCDSFGKTTQRLLLRITVEQKTNLWEK